MADRSGQASLTTLDLSDEHGRRPFFSVWRRIVDAELRQVALDLHHAQAVGRRQLSRAVPDVDRLADAAWTDLKRARDILHQREGGFWVALRKLPYEFVSVWTGSEHETCLAAVHRVETLLILLVDDAKVRVEALKMQRVFRDSHALALGDPRRRSYEDIFNRVAGGAVDNPGPSITAERGPDDQPSVSPMAGSSSAPPPDPPATADRADTRPAGSSSAPGNGSHEKLLPPISAADRVALSEIKRAQLEDWGIARSKVRTFRNILTCVIPFLVAALTATALVAWQNPSLVPLRTVPQSSDVAVIESYGAFGGMLSSLWALSRLRQFQRFYGLPLAQLILKIPSGAATALVGVLLLQNGLLGSLGPVSAWNKLLPYAVLFGVAQVALTRTVDARAQELLGSANAKAPAKSSTIQPVQQIDQTA